MTITTGREAELVVPLSLQRRAGIKPGDRLKLKASRNTITITAVRPETYEPTKAESVAIRTGEAQIARGETVGLSDLLNDLDRSRRKGRAKATRKVSR